MSTWIGYAGPGTCTRVYFQAVYCEAIQRRIYLMRTAYKGCSARFQETSVITQEELSSSGNSWALGSVQHCNFPSVLLKSEGSSAPDCSELIRARMLLAPDGRGFERPGSPRLQASVDI